MKTGNNPVYHERSYFSTVLVRFFFFRPNAKKLNRLNCIQISNQNQTTTQSSCIASKLNAIQDSLQCRRFHLARASGLILLLSPIFLCHRIKDGGFIVAIRLTSFRPPKIRLHCRLHSGLQHFTIYCFYSLFFEISNDDLNKGKIKFKKSQTLDDKKLNLRV